MESVAKTGVDPGQRLSDYVTYIGDRWSRGIDPTSTYDPYSAGLRLRVLPALGHLPVTMITAGVIDRAVDRWERDHGRSTVKNTVAPLVLVLDEAVRDGLIPRNPAMDRARRRSGGRSFGSSDSGAASPRDLALPDVVALDRLVERVAATGADQCWGDMVTILATTALRISEVSGLQVGDIDLVRGLLHVERQTYPGRGGLVTKQTKGRRRRMVPIIEPLRGTLVRPTIGRPAGGPASERPTWWGDHDRDAAGRDALGRARDRARPARPCSPWSSPHSADVDGGRGRAVACAAAGGGASGSRGDEPRPASRRAGDVGRWSRVLGLVVPNWSPADGLDGGWPCSRGAGAGWVTCGYVDCAVGRADRI